MPLLMRQHLSFFFLFAISHLLFLFLLFLLPSFLSFARVQLAWFPIGTHACMTLARARRCAPRLPFCCISLRYGGKTAVKRKRHEMPHNEDSFAWRASRNALITPVCVCALQAPFLSASPPPRIRPYTAAGVKSLPHGPAKSAVT